MDSRTSAAQSSDTRAGKYLTFVLDGGEFGFEILKVREIIGMIETTRVPSMPECVEGVINLRGKVIPVINLRRKFGLPDTEQTAETCIIVLEVTGAPMGVICDRVSEVQDIRGDDIEDAPGVGSEVDQSYIRAMAKSKGRVKILLDADSVLGEACTKLAAQV
jgi:purine-binding chemotaxis protein CheW